MPTLTYYRNKRYGFDVGVAPPCLPYTIFGATTGGLFLGQPQGVYFWGNHRGFIFGATTGGLPLRN
ncbi:MAG: hypothetical protein EAZ87_17715 [Nostocales cyanobacterium]|nr:MAG: hypothetical protein EAZ87_17715 [Nostocales cyanobacterium]